MDDNLSPDSSAASADVASVQEPTVSATVSEAPAADNSQVANPGVPVEAPQASASEAELPDDQAFLQLNGEQRAQNWKQLRTQYAETKGKLSEYQPVFEQVQQYGGFEQLQEKAQLADLLFSPVMGEDQQPQLDDFGLPQYTAQPFVERMVQESPQILQEVMLTGFDAPNPLEPNETMGHWFLRERLGLDPALIQTYQQIKSPQDAARMIVQSGGIDPAELQVIPEQFHEAYKAMTPREREELALYSDPEVRDSMLHRVSTALKVDKFEAQQQQRDEQEKIRASEEKTARVQEMGTKYLQETVQKVVGRARTQLEATPFTGDAEMDGIAWDTIINKAVNATAQAMPLENKRMEDLLRLSAQYEADGDKYRAREARVEAEKITQRLDDAFKKEVTRQTGVWSRNFAGSRQALQQQKQNAQPRIEIGSNGNSPASEGTQFNAPPPGQRFGLGPARINELAAQLAMQKAGQR